MCIVTSGIPLCAAITTGVLKIKITPINENYVEVGWLLILLDAHFQVELGNQITSLYNWCKVLYFSRVGVVIHILQGSFYISDNIYTDSRILWATYYIDTSVLLENIPLVKFIKTTSGTRVVYFP